MEHIIQKQTFEITAPTLTLMQTWEKRAQDIVNDIINPATERCFNEISVREETVIIEKLEIDLGVISKKTNSQLRDSALMELSRQLKNKDNYVHTHENIISKDLLKEVSHHTMSKQETNVSGFIYFLIHGRMPWWSIPGQVEFHGYWIQHLSPRQTEWIAQELTTHHHARERLVYQFDVEFITTILTYYNPALAKSVLLSWKGLEKISLAYPNKTIRLRYSYWSYWLGKCVGYAVDETLLIETIKQWVVYTPEVDVQLSALLGLGKQPKDSQVNLLNDEEKALVELLGKVFSIAKNKDLPKELTRKQKLPKDKQENEKQGYDQQKIKNAPGSVDSSESHQNSKEHSGQKLDVNLKSRDLDVQQNQQEKIIYPSEDINQLYTDAAGLVLVHPFLTELFRSEKLWDNQGWTSSSAQHQAVLLVAWLAFGETGIPEYQLIMPKLLCGMVLEEPIDTTVTLPESCFRSAAELLEAIIQHWKVLGSTSAEGLREGFIGREGKLTSNDNGWQLIIEKKAQDILVSKLPWGISIIQLPWFQKKKIFVDWI